MASDMLGINHHRFLLDLLPRVITLMSFYVLASGWTEFLHAVPEVISIEPSLQK